MGAPNPKKMSRSEQLKRPFASTRFSDVLASRLGDWKNFHRCSLAMLLWLVVVPFANALSLQPLTSDDVEEINHGIRARAAEAAKSPPAASKQTNSASVTGPTQSREYRLLLQELESKYPQINPDTNMFDLGAMRQMTRALKDYLDRGLGDATALRLAAFDVLGFGRTAVNVPRSATSGDGAVNRKPPEDQDRSIRSSVDDSAVQGLVTGAVFAVIGILAGLGWKLARSESEGARRVQLVSKGLVILSVILLAVNLGPNDRGPVLGLAVVAGLAYWVIKGFKRKG